MKSGKHGEKLGPKPKKSEETVMGLRFDIHPYQPGDEAEILDLFRLSFGKQLPLEYWNWRFRDNPTGQVFIELAWDRKALAAHYAVSPVVISVKGHDCLTALSMTTMTHPNYRGLGLFPKLAGNIYRRLDEEKYYLVWGFPNDQSHRGLIQGLQWRDIHEIPMFHLDLTSWSGAGNRDQVVKLDDFDESFEDLWQRAQSDYVMLVKRDMKYLRWRFQKHPHHKYRVLGCFDNNQLMGYVVFRPYGQDEIDIVDLFGMRVRSAGYRLISAILEDCKQEGRQKVNIWLPLNHPLRADLEQIGFRNKAPITYWGMRAFRPLPDDTDASDMRQWFYMLSDSDVY